MAIIKCKMCGGDLDLSEGLSVCECEYCGTKQTVPTADSDKKLTLFARANRLRAANEFDKAESVYESIVADFPEEAEAYWGLVLCKYGIEYVDDPATGKKIPTCHRSSFDSVLDDVNFEQACENADGVARRQYREEAKELERIRQGILEVSGKEEPYDIFICYKETDESGERTIDSVIAQDVYDALRVKGYRVFFSRISLEDKLGVDYEPYIFAALNSAKLMLAFGTDFEYYNAVWVKNEWSRFLKLMEKDKSKHLIPCYKDLDPYDMPKEFRRLQAQDMGKVGALQDLLRGVEKLLPRKSSESEHAPAAPQVIQQVVQGGGPNVTALLQRGQMALEDGEWDKAKEYYDQVLNMDAQDAQAYLGLALAGFRMHSIQEIAAVEDRQLLTRITGDSALRKVQRFATEELKLELDRQLAKANAGVTKKEELMRRKAEAEEAERQRRAAEAEEAERQRRAEAVAAFQRTSKTKSLIAGSSRCTAAVGMDGTILMCGAKFDVSDWTGMVGVALGGNHVVALRKDGRVFARGSNGFGQCDVNSWIGITAVAAGRNHTVGLQKNGNVLACGLDQNQQCQVRAWRNIIAIAAGEDLTAGLTQEGTVVSTKPLKAAMQNIGFIAAGKELVCLNLDGETVFPRSVFQGETGLLMVATGKEHIVALRADGSVIATGSNTQGQCNVSRWRNIVAVTVSDTTTIGLQRDGTVIATGDNDYGQCRVDGWHLFQEIGAHSGSSGVLNPAEKTRLRTLRLNALTTEKAALEKELSNLGLFSAKRRKEIEARLAAIEGELKTL